LPSDFPDTSSHSFNPSDVILTLKDSASEQAYVLYNSPSALAKEGKWWPHYWDTQWSVSH